MRMARKKALVVEAYRLGEKSPEIEALMKEGKIKKTEDGRFEIFSQEVLGETGEIVGPGDYVKIDSAGRPYPNSRNFFEKNHRHIKGNQYEQRSEALYIWTAKNDMCQEVEYLIKEKGLVLDAEHPDRYFQAPLWGTTLYASKTAVLVCYKIVRDEEKILDVQFNFVEKEEFDRTYELLAEKETVTYDAFISYSHSEPDAFIAQKIHFMMEHYRVPGKIQELSGKKKIERVFRDREELPLSSNLDQNIRTALEHSEYLILICSPRAARSRWVQREVEVFLQTHTKDKVLTLLAEGEPEEVFPEELCYEEECTIQPDGTEKVLRTKIEPMAADIRGKDRKEIEKKLKGEFLRLLAPMLSCTYDMLKQRHREYKLRKMVAAAATIVCLAVSFTVYAFYQAAAIDEQYQESRRNQARYLSRISGELLEEGDRTGALKTALAIAPEKTGEDLPVVPEQMYALNQALYAYDKTDMITFKPDTSYEMEGEAMLQMSLSPEETGFFCMDQVGNAYILNTKTGECIWKITPKEIPAYEGGDFLWFAPITEEKAVLVSAHEIIYLDWKKKKTECVIRAEEGEKFSKGTDIQCAVRNSYIGITNGEKVWVYDLEKKTCIQKVNCVEDERKGCSPGAVAFSADGNILAVGLSTTLNGEWKSEEDGLFLLSTVDGSVGKISEASIRDVTFYGEDKMAALEYEFLDEEFYDISEVNYRICMYDRNSGQRIWASEAYRFSENGESCIMPVMSMEVNGEVQPVLTAVVRDRLIVLNPDTGKVMVEKNYSEDIQGLGRYDEKRYLVGIADGSVYLTLMDMDTAAVYYRAGEVSTQINGMLYSAKQNVVIQLVNEGRKVLFCRQQSDEQMKPLSIDGDIEDVTYLSTSTEAGEKEVYRCVLYDTRGSGGNSDLIVYRPDSKEKVYEYHCRGEKESIEQLEMHNINGKPWLWFWRSGGSGGASLVAVDLKTGKTSGEERILCTENEMKTRGWGWSILDIENPRVFHSAQKAVMWNSDGFAITTFTEDKMNIPKAEELIEIKGTVYDVQITADDKYIVFKLHSLEEEWLQVWNVEEEHWQKIEGKNVKLLPRESKGCFALGQETDVLALYTQEGGIEIIDLSEGTCSEKLSFGYFERIDFKFMNHDQFLVGCGDDQYLNLWDVGTGEVRMRMTDHEIKSAGDIYVDGNAQYFGLIFHGISASDDYYYSSQMRLYYVDEKGCFYPFAEVPDGDVSFDAGEIFVRDKGGYYSPFYGYQELRRRAEQLLDGEGLSAEEKRQYFISE